AIAAETYDYTCALLSSGTVKCWGAGNPTPAAQPGISGATALDGGDAHMCVVVTGGAVKCWGSNSAGQLGDGTTTDSATPATVGGITGATIVAAGAEHTCVRQPPGGAKCWGDNSQGQLGNGNMPTDSLTPVSVTGLTGVRVLIAGTHHTCAIVDGAA